MLEPIILRRHGPANVFSRGNGKMTIASNPNDEGRYRVETAEGAT
jgi:hypothetical protein